MLLEKLTLRGVNIFSCRKICQILLIKISSYFYIWSYRKKFKNTQNCAVFGVRFIVIKSKKHNLQIGGDSRRKEDIALSIEGKSRRLHHSCTKLNQTFFQSILKIDSCGSLRLICHGKIYKKTGFCYLINKTVIFECDSLHLL
jgi:hypothetical protein